MICICIHVNSNYIVELGFIVQKSWISQTPKKWITSIQALKGLTGLFPLLARLEKSLGSFLCLSGNLDWLLHFREGSALSFVTSPKKSYFCDVSQKKRSYKSLQICDQNVHDILLKKMVDQRIKATFPRNLWIRWFACWTLLQLNLVGCWISGFVPKTSPTKIRTTKKTSGFTPVSPSCPLKCLKVVSPPAAFMESGKA